MNRQVEKEVEDLREWQNKIVENMGLVQHTAKRIREYIPKEMPWDDVLQYGYVGLVEAAKRYEVGKGKFSTFAGIRIFGSIMDGVFLFLGLKRYRKEGSLGMRSFRSIDLVELQNVFAKNLQEKNVGDEWMEVINEKLSLEQALQKLRPDEKELIDACYFQQKTWAEYAQEKYVNIEWVYLMHRRILKKMRRWLKS